MPALPKSRLAALLEPFQVDGAPKPGLTFSPAPTLHENLSAYLDLLLRWNARTNLTAVREPEEIVTRHFGESLFAGYVLAPELQDGMTLLDLGTGAGLPGVPLQLLFPGIKVTLAESQGKKVAFLRELVRVLELPTGIWAQRAEQLPEGTGFDIVTLRAVDRMSAMASVGWGKVRHGGWLLEMTTQNEEADRLHPIPGTRDRVVALRRKS